MEFRKFDRTKIDLVSYCKEYLKQHQNTEILIGCDSQNRNRYTTYAVIVALYEPGHGAHVIYKRERTEREKNRGVRLMNEVWKSVEVATYLRDEGFTIKYIDIDINPNPRFKSNEVYESACGLVRGCGFECRYKTLAPLCTTIADFMARK
jgi:predicted RNase H-related nuclease YkuK (DUF458 family)